MFGTAVYFAKNAWHDCHDAGKTLEQKWSFETHRTCCSICVLSRKNKIEIKILTVFAQSMIWNEDAKYKLCEKKVSKTTPLDFTEPQILNRQSYWDGDFCTGKRGRRRFKSF